MNKKTWILLADGAKALVFCQKGQGESIDQVEKLESGESKMQDHEMGTDKPGRSHESMGMSRSSVDTSDFQNQAKEKFAHDVAHWLIKNESRFDHLIVVAAPKTLGQLRPILHDHKIKNKIIKEVDKDLTTTPEQNIGEELKKVLHIAI